MTRSTRVSTKVAFCSPGGSGLQVSPVYIRWKPMSKPRKGTILKSRLSQNTFKVINKEKEGNDVMYTLERVNGEEPNCRFVEWFVLLNYNRA